MSDGKEVKRFWPRVNESGAVFMDQEHDGGYVKYTDHIRSIAELRAEVERLKIAVVQINHGGGYYSLHKAVFQEGHPGCDGIVIHAGEELAAFQKEESKDND